MKDYIIPNTKIDFMASDLQMNRLTAAKYLNKIIQATDLIEKIKIGRENYYINMKLVELFVLHNSY